VTSQYVYWQNLRFSAVVSNSLGVHVFDNCDFNSSSADGVQTTGRSYLINCRGDGCAADVINYQGTGQGFEIGCSTGVTTANGSVAGHNATTGHSNTRQIRLNGNYRRSPNVIHDIGQSKSLVFGTTVTQGTGFNVGAATSSSSGENTEIWLYRCSVTGGATRDVETDTDGFVYTFETPVVTSLGNVSAFSEASE
jgi:hypothetical protein